MSVFVWTEKKLTVWSGCDNTTLQHCFERTEKKIEALIGIWMEKQRAVKLIAALYRPTVTIASAINVLYFRTHSRRNNKHSVESI